MQKLLPKPWENTYKTPRLRKPLPHSQVEYLRAYLLKIEWPDMYTMQRLQRRVSLLTKASFHDWRKTELPQLKRTTKASPQVRRRVHRCLCTPWQATSRHWALLELRNLLPVTLLVTTKLVAKLVLKLMRMQA